MDGALTSLALHEEAEALGHIGSFVVGLSADGRAIWSKECRRILGVELDAPICAQTFWDLLHPDDRGTFERSRAAAFAARTPYEVTIRIRRLSDGQTRSVLIRARPICDERGVVVETVGVLQDVTDRLATGDRLRASDARFARLCESGIVGIAICRGEVIVEANDAYLDIVGFSREDLTERRIRWAAMTPRDHLDGNEIARAQILATGIARPWEKEYVRKDGTRVPVLVGIATLGEDESIVVVNDLREQKRAEAALRHTKDMLAQSQKMEAIGLLAGGVAHDFNNMLSVILSNAGMIADELRPEDPICADLAEISAAAHRAADLTRHLLAFTRKQVFTPRVVDPVSVVADLEKMLKRLIGEHIALNVESAQSGIRKVSIDVGQIEQVIMNVIVNARDAMPGGGTIRVKTANVDVGADLAASIAGLRSGPYVRITVEDTGHGMSKATMQRIFEPFFTMKPKGKGTGLGLSSSLGIVQQSGGAMSVESELGVGTTFAIFLPMTSAPSDLPASGAAPPARLHGEETILVVEDEDSVRKTLRSLLTQHGYRVVEARNAGEAFLTCEQHEGTIHLMLSDVVMPFLNGPELAGRVRALCPSMRTVFMSGYLEGPLGFEDLASLGAFVQKPFTPERVLSAVRTELDAPARSTPTPRAEHLRHPTAPANGGAGG
jgi:two-component system cell cycle sensor histidine kinase/response regulator CckA